LGHPCLRRRIADGGLKGYEREGPARNWSKGKVFNRVHTVGRVRRLGKEFKGGDELANGPLQLVAES